jgi:Uma2 family endonuclease
LVNCGFNCGVDTAASIRPRSSKSCRPQLSDYDHGTKFAHYREIPTLQDYLLVHTEEILIEHHARQPDGNWLLSERTGRDASVTLSIGCTLALDLIYPS